MHVELSYIISLDILFLGKDAMHKLIADRINNQDETPLKVNCIQSIPK